MKELTKWLRYSGAAINFSLNPLYWKVLPWWRDETNCEWGQPERTWACGFLFLTIRVWIDRGDW